MNSSNESNNKPSSIPSGDNDTYYQNKNVDRYTKLINGWLQEENARLRSLIDIAFDTGRKGPYPTKEQFKKDNNL
jgi:hypothetical protein